MDIANMLVDCNLVTEKADCQTAKFNSPPNVPAIRYHEGTCKRNEEQIKS